MSGGKKDRALDMMTLVGGIGGTGAICVAHVVEGGYMSQLLQPGAFLIVFIGTLMCVVLQFSGADMRVALNDSLELLMPQVVDLEATVEQIMELAKLARRKGMVAIDREVQGLDDPFLKQAMGMAADGIEPKALRESLERRKDTLSHEAHLAGHYWTALGGFAPTIGVLGAVLGLMHVMAHLDDPNKLGAGIAVAFVATVYGVGGANLLFLPMGGKLAMRADNRMKRLEVIIEGTCSIASGENPMITEQKLNAFLHSHGGAEKGADGGGGKGAEAAA